jgi:hypothetical protein
MARSSACMRSRREGGSRVVSMATTQLKNHVSRFCELSPGLRSHGSVQYTGEASTNSTSGRLRRRSTAWRSSAARSPRLDPTERNTLAMPDLAPLSGGG